MNRFSRLGLLAAAVASLAVTGCGSVSGTSTVARTGRPAGTATATAAGLCAAVSEVDALTVRRGGAWPVNHLRFRFPRQIMVTRPQQARPSRGRCARCRRCRAGSLPVRPTSVISYRLEFAAAGRRLAVVTVDPGGCERVVGTGPARWAEKSAGFWRVLSRAAVVPWPRPGLDGCGGTGLMCAQGAP